MKNLQSKHQKSQEDDDDEDMKSQQPLPKIQKREIPQSPKPSTSSQKDSMKNDMKDFFKDRASAFKAKDPEDMKAPPTPPKSESSQQKQAKERALEAAMKQFLPVILPRGKMSEKLKKAAPYNIFLTTITDAPQTHNEPLSVTFQELLDPSLGELESSVQFNFMVDIAWLLAQYTFARCRHLPLHVFYGSEEKELEEISKKLPNVMSQKVPIPTPIGCHHTKMMFFFYTDKSMRVVVSTANLYEDDWHNRTEGLWISEKLPALPDGISHVNNGESVTNFREDLMKYLMVYKMPKLQPIIARIRTTDFSSVKVFFVASTPGTHNDQGKGIEFGHLRLGSLLAKHSAPIDDSCPIICQASSIGSLGPHPHVYLQGEIAQSFRKDTAPVGIRKQPKVKLIYPSLNNVLNSHDKIQGGGCLPYDGKINEKQLWLKEYLYQWRANSRNRTRAMPHIKSYCRYSERGLYWFHLTSANMSRSAWGSLNKSNKLNTSLRINSYEAGVLFCPRIVINQDRFPMNSSQRKDDAPLFRLPYDEILVPYAADDVPFTSDYLKSYLIQQYGGALV